MRRGVGAPRRRRPDRGQRTFEAPGIYGLVTTSQGGNGVQHGTVYGRAGRRGAPAKDPCERGESLAVQGRDSSGTCQGWPRRQPDYDTNPGRTGEPTMTAT